MIGFSMPKPYVYRGMVNNMRKKALTIAILSLLLSGCTKQPEKVHTRYTANGHYYTNGTLMTEDGNVWIYNAETISNRKPYDDMAVWVGFDDNGTPNDITDDIILGLVWDRNTSIYDRLEKELSEEFTVERNGNNLKIGVK